MKYTTRLTLVTAILLSTGSSAFIFQSWDAFLLTTYPLIAGWFIGECINIPEEPMKRKWRIFKDSVAIRIINIADYIGGWK